MAPAPATSAFAVALAVELHVERWARSAAPRPASCRRPRSARPPAPARRRRGRAARPAPAPSCPGPCRRPGSRPDPRPPGASPTGSRPPGRAAVRPASALGSGGDSSWAARSRSMAARKLASACDRYALQHFVQPGGGGLRDARAVAVGFRHRRQFGQPLLERACERRVYALAHGHEAAAAAGGGQQRFQFQHPAFVDRRLPADAEPVALALHRQGELRSVHASPRARSCPWASPRPPPPPAWAGLPPCSAPARDRRPRHSAAASSPATSSRKGKSVEHRIQGGALGGKIAPRAHALAAQRRHQACAPGTGRRAADRRPQRRDHQPQHQALADGGKLGAQPRLRRHLARRLGGSACTWKWPPGRAVPAAVPRGRRRARRSGPTRAGPRGAARR